MKRANPVVLAINLCVGIFFSSHQAAGQISVTNLAEYQVGNLPDSSPSNLTTLYNSLDLSYYKEYINAAFKFERFQHGDQNKDYAELTQKSINISHDPFDITLGNFYEIFGRGLLLRSFEIQGNILEDTIYRTRYGFYRDIEGLLVKFQSDQLEIKLLRGRPLFNLLPPTLDQDLRRPVLLEGIETNFTFAYNYTIGSSYLRENKSNDVNEYGSISFAANLPLDVQFYGEYAQKFSGTKNLFSLSDESAHALYTGANTIIGPLGLSFEIKDYKNFLLNFNDPPPIVKEHQYIVLNRSTHVIEPLYETGWQAEALFTSKGGQQITMNFARSTNKLLEEDAVFKEFFTEASLHFNDQSFGKFFIDLSEDAFKFEKDRIAFGAYLTKEWMKNWGTVLGLEYQQLTRNIATEQEIKNYATTLEISRAPLFSLGFIWERSNDPELTDKFSTPELETTPKNWLAVTLGYQINQNNFLNVFYGSRRGGPACTSGICYNVLDFEGFEMRLSSNF